MAKYRKIDPKIWNDQKFNRLSNNGKLVFFMLLTHPHMTALGAMRGNCPGLAAEIGWTEKAFREAFQEAQSKDMLKHDEKASIIWLPKFLKYNKPESPNVVKSWGNALDYLPECNLKFQLIQHIKDYIKALPKAFQEALPKAFRKSMPNQEQEQEQEQELLTTSFQEDCLSPSDEGVTKNKVPDCPQKKIISLYHEILPELSRVNEWTDPHDKYLRARWRENPERQNLNWWRAFFHGIRESEFLMGRVNGWQATLGWIVKKNNFSKIVNGHYANRNQQGGVNGTSNGGRRNNVGGFSESFAEKVYSGGTPVEEIDWLKD